MTREEMAKRIEEAARYVSNEFWQVNGADGSGSYDAQKALRAALALPVEEPAPRVSVERAKREAERMRVVRFLRDAGWVAGALSVQAMTDEDPTAPSPSAEWESRADYGLCRSCLHENADEDQDPCRSCIVAFQSDCRSTPGWEPTAQPAPSQQPGEVCRRTDSDQAHHWTCRCIQRGGTTCTCAEVVTLRERGDAA